MNNVSGHFGILAAAGVAAVLLSGLTAIGRFTEASAPEQASVVVTLPQHPERTCAPAGNEVPPCNHRHSRGPRLSGPRAAKPITARGMLRSAISAASGTRGRAQP